MMSKARLPTGTSERAEGASQFDAPYATNRVHRIGNLRLNVTNWGFIGSGFESLLDPCTVRPAPSLEFPSGSALEYLFAGALWIGAVRGRDTLVSVGRVGDANATEMLPKPFPEGAITERTNRPILRGEHGSLCPDVLFSPDAVSEQDFIATYYDTVVSSVYIEHDQFDGRPHRPIGLEITQSSYSWSFSFAQGFILVDYRIKNISDATLKDVYVGLYMDHDVYHNSDGFRSELGWTDDIAGLLQVAPTSPGSAFTDTVNTAWIADNDGDPANGRFGDFSPTGVAAVRVLRAPDAAARLSFNWWVSDEPSRDWGPNRRGFQVEYLLGNLGTPYGDKAKYQLMANGEIDYDQVETAVSHETTGWLPPPRDPSLALNLADGADTRYLLSFGPFELPRDSMLPLTIAILAARDFHTAPMNFRNYYDAENPNILYEHLGFENLGQLAKWAGWVYDAPGLDTDGDGYRGKYRLVGNDTVYYAGDDVPDFRTPPPPPVPTLQCTTREGKIVLTWNGETSETTPDPFSLVADFEGYRVYMSRTGKTDDFVFLSQRDNVNFTRYRWLPSANRWASENDPFTLDSLKALYDELTRNMYGYSFHPDSFKTPLVARALFETQLDDRDPSRLDTNYYYFAAYDANATADDQDLATAIALGMRVTGTIRKLHPNASKDSIAYRENGREYKPFYEYEYALDGLPVAEPVFLGVTTFDFGNAAVGLPSIEASPTANALDLWPVNSAEVVRTERPKSGVYPNPYRISDYYNFAGWENPRGLEPDPERARKVTFYNVPDTCVVSIWSIDGDLVRRLEHRADPASSEATVVVWNLITRNTQAVKTGIYIYSIESRFGTDVGKLVIVK